MKKQWLAIIISSSLAAAAVLGLMRLLAPQLLGIPLDLEIVQSSERKIPFYDVVLNKKEITGKKPYIKDPYLKHRSRPLNRKSPSDLLGFRNPGVPNKIDVLAVGDSQTWGNNATLHTCWPGHLSRLLSRERASVGGWGAVEYLEMTKRLLLLEPRVVVVAFYTGNDPLDSYGMAYAKERWASLRPSDLPKKVKGPHVNYPPKKSELWSVEFDDGVKTVFTPHGRYACNRDHPAPDAGYVIIENVARRIAERVEEAHARAIFTIIPTKELAFYPRIARAGIPQDATYAALVKAETNRIQGLRESLADIHSARYVEVVEPLQQAVLNTSVQYYKRNSDGHPTGRGYEVIARAIAGPVGEYL